jgi:uncharacterized protein YjaG (DUF416 family)
MEEGKIDLSLDMCLEEEKKKCLKNLQQFYKKYGCEKIETLRTYLSSLYETITDDNEKEEIKKQLELLEHYS